MHFHFLLSNDLDSLFAICVLVWLTMCECFFLSFIHSLNELKRIIIANCGWRIHWRFECLECIQWMCAQRKCDIQKKILLLWNENIDRKLKIKKKQNLHRLVLTTYSWESFSYQTSVLSFIWMKCVYVFHLSYIRIWMLY